VTIRQLYCKMCSTYFHRDQMAASNMVNVIKGHLDPDRRPVYLCPIDDWSNNKIEKRKATNARELSSKPDSSSKRLKESPSKPGLLARGKRKTENEAEAQAAHRSEPNEDNLDDSGSEYSEDEDDLDIDEDEDGESELEENDQEEGEDEDGESELEGNDQEEDTD
ncbi:hypothetical protein BGZ49_006663, partial [Haplosporangium sp. Z 27]